MAYRLKNKVAKPGLQATVIDVKDVDYPQYGEIKLVRASGKVVQIATYFNVVTRRDALDTIRRYARDGDFNVVEWPR